MDAWFSICLLGMIASVPLHFVSVEHLKLQERFGKEKGTKTAETIGQISGWGFFSFWFGMWVSPQPIFSIPILNDISISTQLMDFSISFLHLIISIPLIIAGAWFGIKGVEGTTLKVAETHRTEKIVTSGVYSIVRHPQYLGGLLSHLGITLILRTVLSSLYSSNNWTCLSYFKKRGDRTSSRVWQRI